MTTVINISLHPGEFLCAVAESNADSAWVRIVTSLKQPEPVNLTIHIPAGPDQRGLAHLLAETLNEVLQRREQPPVPTTSH